MNTVEEMVGSARKCIASRNWYAALSLALTLPDICAALEATDGKASARKYIDWFNRYILDKYTRERGPSRPKRVFLNGEDCYALRCAFLHQGSDDISDQRIRKALNSFIFVQTPLQSIVIHCNLGGDTLQLQIDIFCEDIYSGVQQWLNDVKDSRMVQQRISEMIRIKQMPSVRAAP